MNWTDFFNMGGYAVYVWTSYGLMLVVLVGNLVLSYRRQSEVLKSVSLQLTKENKTS